MRVRCDLFYAWSSWHGWWIHRGYFSQKSWQNLVKSCQNVSDNHIWEKLASSCFIISNCLTRSQCPTLPDTKTQISSCSIVSLLFVICPIVVSLFAVYRLSPHVWVCSHDRPRRTRGGMGGRDSCQGGVVFFNGLSGWQNDWDDWEKRADERGAKLQHRDMRNGKHEEQTNWNLDNDWDWRVLRM